MAFSTGNYAGVNDALEQLKDFVDGEGWAVNLFADDSYKVNGGSFIGKRLHVQKTINGVDCFADLRSCSGQSVFEGWTSTANQVTGICLNSSTGFNGSNDWDKQPGHPTYDSKASGSCVDAMKDSGTFYFFSTDTSVFAVFETESTDEDWRTLSFGVTDLGVAFAVSSGGRHKLHEAARDTRSSFLAYNHYFPVATYGWFLINGTFKRLSSYGYFDTNVVLPVLDAYDAGATSTINGEYPSIYVQYSPSPFNGNAPLPATMLNFHETSNVYKSIGTIEGIHAVNMKNFENGREVSIGADTYVLFRVWNQNYSGFAYKK